MKKLALFWFVLILLGCSNGFKDYRHNPFQFPYPEYRLKADVVTIQPNHKISGPENAIVIDAFDITIDIDKKYADEAVRKNDKVDIKKDGRLKFVILSNPEQLMGCNEVVRELEKDFCSAFTSTREYYEKLFLLTPEDLSKEKYSAAGNRWIVHQKGSMFQDAEKILIYKSDGFTVFRKDFKPSGRYHTKVELVIFNQEIKDSYVTMGFVEKDEILIRQILETMRLSANA